MTRHALLFLPLLACATDDLAPEPLDSPGVPRIPVQFPWGTQLEPYEIVDGLVIIRGDIAIERADQLARRSTAHVGNRWPGGVVRYAYDTSIPVGDTRRTNLANAIADLAARTPLDFQLAATQSITQATPGTRTE